MSNLRFSFFVLMFPLALALQVAVFLFSGKIILGSIAAVLFLTVSVLVITRGSITAPKKFFEVRYFWWKRRRRLERKHPGWRGQSKLKALLKMSTGF